MRRYWPWLVAFVSGCGGEELFPPGQITLTVGHELDAWSREPVPTTVEVDRLLETGTRERLETVNAPAERFSIGRGSVASYELNAKDTEGNRLLFARSLPIEPEGFAGRTLPLFVSRVGEFARPPEGFLTPPGADAAGAIAAGRYLVLAGVQDDGSLQTSGYDLGMWEPLNTGVRLTCPSEPCRFRSFVITQETVALGIGDDWAFWFDLATLASGDAPLPPGLASFADVSGGRAINTPAGDVYLVGATREQPPSRSVLLIRADGRLQALELGIARAGATATWVEQHGLVVVGGSAVGAGAEFLGDGTLAFVQVPYPPDDSVGAALVAVDDATVLRVGGKIAGFPAPTVALTHTCTLECLPTARGLPVELDRGQGFALADGRVLIAGTAPDGQTAVIELDAEGSARPLPLREPRAGALAFPLSTTHVAIAGGTLLDGTRAASIELFAP